MANTLPGLEGPVFTDGIGELPGKSARRFASGCGGWA